MGDLDRLMYGYKKGWMGPIEEQETIAEIASSLASLLPEGWKSADYLIMAVGAYSVSQLRAEDVHGETVHVSLPAAILVNVKTLRSGMYKSDEGTWFTWNLKLWAEGKFRSSFDYDNPPPFLIQPGLGEYRREVQLFPRSPEFIPEWLQENLDEIDRRLR